jgi:molecular chaperone GrpE
VTDSATGGVPTSGTDVAGDDTRTTDDAPVSPDEVVDPADAVPESAATVDGAPAHDEHDRLAADLAERTESLQRVSAEYANYRRRVERDREGTVANAKAQIAGELLTVLDDIDRAATHGDLNGPFKVVADRLTETLQRAGLTAFGAEGDAFDPGVHEAVAQETSPDVTGPTVSTVMRRGYRFGDRVLRPAMVAVADADPDAGRAPQAQQPQGAAESGPA